MKLPPEIERFRARHRLKKDKVIEALEFLRPSMPESSTVQDYLSALSDYLFPPVTTSDSLRGLAPTSIIVDELADVPDEKLLSNFTELVSADLHRPQPVFLGYHPITGEKVYG
jgi:hypothetical protein